MNGQGRILYNWPDGYCEPQLRFTGPEQLQVDHYDVIIVGAGVVGCGLAYKLSAYELRVLLVDQNHDVGEGTSKANSAIVHTGFDASPGTLESELVTSASRAWPELARRLQIPFRQTSALLLAVDRQQEKQLPEICEKAGKNGVDDVELLTAQEARRLEPNISSAVRGAVLVRREGIADPFATCIAFAEVALLNGVDILLGVRIVGVQDAGNGLKVVTSHEGHRFRCRFLVNVAGLGCRDLTRAYGGEDFHINPRRGQFLVFDKQAGGLISRILLPVPTAKTKGILVSPTIFGNVLMGPTAEDLPPEHVTATNTTADGLEQVRSGGLKLCGELDNWPVVATYAGLRCNCREGSYIIRPNDGRDGIVSVIGIRSTGFTSSATLAEYVIQELADKCGLELQQRPGWVDHRPGLAKPGWWENRPFEDARQMAKQPKYGRLICYCEQISEGELLDALNSPLRPRSIDALRRRTRAGMGRCQGFNCHVRLARILADQCGIAIERVTKRGPGSEIV